MRIRQFIAALMILLSLSAQARTVLACDMMPGAALAACCCPSDSGDQCPSTSHGHQCCDQLTPADAPLAHTVAAAYRDHHAPTAAPELSPVAAVESHLLPISFDAGGKRYLSPQLDASRHRVRPLYLQTARLRL